MSVNLEKHIGGWADRVGVSPVKYKSWVYKEYEEEKNNFKLKKKQHLEDTKRDA